MTAAALLPSAVLFDMDGTLIDSEGLWLIAERRTMAEFGAGWSEQDQEACLGGPLERVVAYMLDRAGLEQSESAVVEARLLGHIEGLFIAEPLTWRPGALELLGQARELGIPSALVTASWRRLIDAVHSSMTREFGSDPFDVIIGGDEVEQSKPHPAPYLRAAERLGVPVAQCLAIEDSPTGIASAVASGAGVVAVPHLAAPPDLPGVVVCRTLAGSDLAALWALVGAQGSRTSG